MGAHWPGGPQSGQAPVNTQQDASRARRRPGSRQPTAAAIGVLRAGDGMRGRARWPAAQAGRTGCWPSRCARAANWPMGGRWCGAALCCGAGVWVCGWCGRGVCAAPSGAPARLSWASASCSGRHSASPPRGLALAVRPGTARPPIILNFPPRPVFTAPTPASALHAHARPRCPQDCPSRLRLPACVLPLSNALPRRPWTIASDHRAAQSIARRVRPARVRRQPPGSALRLPIAVPAPQRPPPLRHGAARLPCLAAVALARPARPATRRRPNEPSHDFSLPASLVRPSRQRPNCAIHLATPPVNDKKAQIALFARVTHRVAFAASERLYGPAITAPHTLNPRALQPL